MRHSGRYQIDHGVLLQKAYYLACFFFADKEFSRRTKPHELLALLEQRFFESEISRALIELAVGMRVIDDQMKKLPEHDPERRRYAHRLISANGFADGMFTEETVTFRDMCNKILHSDVLEPHFDIGREPHHRGEEEWMHFSGYVHLSGRRGRQTWDFLLAVDDFVNAVCVLLIDQKPAHAI